MIPQMTMHKWRLDAECRDTDTNLFFPPKTMPVEEQYVAERIAIHICESCAVKAECLDYAITNPKLVTEGVWGGHTDKEIQALQRRKVRRGRKAKQ